MKPFQKAQRARETAYPRVSRSQAGRWIGVNPSTIQNLELGRQSKSLRPYIQALAVNLNIPVEWFYDERDTSPPIGQPRNVTAQSPTYRWSEDDDAYLPAGAPLPIHPGLQPPGSPDILSLVVREPGAHGHRAEMGAVILAAREIDIPDRALVLFLPNAHIHHLRFGVLHADEPTLRFTTLLGRPMPAPQPQIYAGIYAIRHPHRAPGEPNLEWNDGRVLMAPASPAYVHEKAGTYGPQR